jgi:glycosyltransferase involved in cell wall biosynthesis
VFVREQLDEANAAAIAAAERLGNVATVYEADDYVFDPYELYLYNDALKRLSYGEQRNYLEIVRRKRELLKRCRFFIGATQILADLAAGLTTRAYVVPNGLSQRQIDLAQQALTQQSAGPARDEVVRIGYLSGTPTHRRDFAVAVPALCRVLDEFPRVRLSLRGYLELPKQLRPYASRIEREPFVAWEELVAETAKLDIAIAPLEMNNPFTEAKSALKYFEAAIVAVPVVAAPTAPFRQAIVDGQNGFLAEDEEGWYRALSNLVSRPDLRRTVGLLARQNALRRFAPAEQAPGTLRVFRDIVKEIRSRG